jgi:hypothetical protein
MHHDDFKFEPVRGLPEALPEGEHILWQGAPDPLRLAKEAWKMNWIIGYFAALAVWRVIVSAETETMTTALGHGIPLLLAGALACLIVYAIAYVQARSTVYTLTNKRAAMRIGAALMMTLNLPYVRIVNASANIRKNGVGTISFEIENDTRISYLMTWPHVRPWAIRNAQPSFRAIPDAARVAAIFADAAESRVSQPVVTRVQQSAPLSGAVAAE